MAYVDVLDFDHSLTTLVDNLCAVQQEWAIPTKSLARSIHIRKFRLCNDYLCPVRGSSRNEELQADFYMQ